MLVNSQLMASEVGRRVNKFISLFVSLCLSFFKGVHLEYTCPRLISMRARTLALYIFFYKESVRSLFILAILLATDKSMVRSAISTMSPPRISGLTLGTTLSVWPVVTYCEFLMAVSRRLIVLLSRGYILLVKIFRATILLMFFFQRFVSPDIQRTVALVTVSSTSPRCAPMSTPNFSATPCSMPNRLFSARVVRRFLTMPSLSALPMCFWSSWTICCLSATVSEGAWRIWVSLASFWKTPCRAERDLAVGSRALVFAAAVY